MTTAIKPVDIKNIDTTLQRELLKKRTSRNQSVIANSRAITQIAKFALGSSACIESDEKEDVVIRLSEPYYSYVFKNAYCEALKDYAHVPSIDTIVEDSSEEGSIDDYFGFIRHRNGRKIQSIKFVLKESR